MQLFPDFELYLFHLRSDFQYDFHIKPVESPVFFYFFVFFGIFFWCRTTKIIFLNQGIISSSCDILWNLTVAPF
ncbi:hypothetical protein RchiOBHm_Chr2g0140321 [Rosa chinensis]|uniref:Uncharacterized protein n=1 Tax=Rosa chinensis TaxID=74649 RepID=A0A2P6RXB9_ROSCH|nr:hypothetical protein RchiOBHm_Chr2g0140321 [Rosa chinensis]